MQCPVMYFAQDLCFLSFLVLVLVLILVTALSSKVMTFIAPSLTALVLLSPINWSRPQTLITTVVRYDGDHSLTMSTALRMFSLEVNLFQACSHQYTCLPDRGNLEESLTLTCISHIQVNTCTCILAFP